MHAMLVWILYRYLYSDLHNKPHALTVVDVETEMKFSAWSNLI